jgi:hypothetical protein|tara:strand:+ start:496 stop:669 length:174 start_codon:yes stop_codon:yes gene_type:complete
MQEQRLDYSSNNEAIINIKEENKILRNNVKELQEQVQSAYKRIKELTINTNQMELDI